MTNHPNGFHVAFVGNPNCGKTAERPETNA